MSTDKQVAHYLRGWKNGAEFYAEDPPADECLDYQRGYRDGMSAYLIAERSERERLVREAEDTEHVARLLSKES